MPTGNEGPDIPEREAQADQAAQRVAAGISHQVEAERIASLQALIPPTLVGGSLFACLAAAFLRLQAPGHIVAAWLVAKLLVAAVRGWDVRRFRLARARGGAPRGARRRLFAGLWVDGALWGALPVLFMPFVSDLGDGLLVASTTSVVAIGTFSLASHRRASAVFLVIALAPLVAAELWQLQPLPSAVAAGLVLFAVVLKVECDRSHRRFSEMVRLRFENAAIAEQRRRALIYAEHSNAAKTRFLASVSHELRTPLNGILGMTQLMADERLTPAQKRSLEVVRHSAEHLVSVIGDLVDLSRVERDRIALSPRPAFLLRTVRDVVALQKPMAEERGLAFHVAVQPGLPQVAVYDEGRVKQVLHHLVGNAVKFTREGEVRLVVKLTDAQALAFEVRDTGEGVPEDAADRIFEPFEQASEDPANRGGAGLGLTVARRIARAMGGDVTLRPGRPERPGRPGAGGRGARFRFSLPYLASDGQLPPAPRDPPPRAAAEVAAAHLPTPETLRAHAHVRPPAPPLDGPVAAPARPAATPLAGRVLVAEDNEVNAIVVSAMLHQLGIDTVRVEDGRQAIEALLRAERAEPGHPPIDLVLMDCQMPLLDGWAATREWRRHEAERTGGMLRRRFGKPMQLPIIALTASAAAGERERCLAAGMDDYVAKPYTRDELRRVLTPWLATEPQREAPAPRR